MSFLLKPVPDQVWVDEMRRIVDQGFLRALRMRHPMITLGDAARASGMTVVRYSELERGTEKPTDDELLRLHRGFMRHGLNR